MLFSYVVAMMQNPHLHDVSLHVRADVYPLLQMRPHSTLHPHHLLPKFLNALPQFLFPARLSPSNTSKSSSPITRPPRVAVPGGKRSSDNLVPGLAPTGRYFYCIYDLIKTDSR